MSRSAQIASLAALRDLRVALVKFSHAVGNALAEADSDLQRTSRWVQQEQALHWQQQLRLRAERLVQAQQALQNKKVHFPSELGSRSCIDEERAVIAARRSAEEARAKAQVVRRWGPELDKQALLYRGAVGGLLRATETDVPRALAGLDRMLDSLEAYLAVQGTEAAAGASAARPAPDEPGAASGESGPVPPVQGGEDEPDAQQPGEQS